MAASPKPLPLVVFGDFTVDLRLMELRRNGLRLKLSGQPFAVLEMLLQHPGEVVTREQLRGRLWREETFVDFDHSLNVSINKLRETLRDSAERPRFIETIPRLGYRFIAPVKIGAVAAETAQKAETTSSLATPTKGVAPAVKPGAPAPVRVHWYAAAVAVILVCALAAYFGHHAWRRSAPAPAAKIMLAVLPFENLTGDPASEYFSDGLTEEMITQLAELQPGRLGVIARTSVMSYKHGDRSIARVASQLGVEYILEGSLRKSGVPGGTGFGAPGSRSASRVRITAQLIQAKDQTHLWAHNYDRDLGDVLTLEREVSSDVAREIQLELTSEGYARLTRPRPVDPEAHELYLEGRFYWNKRTPEGFKRAVEYFKRSIQKDPNYAEAYAGLADSYRFLVDILPPSEVTPKARAAAEKALAIDPNLAEAHASLGLILPCEDWDWEEAKRQFERAIELNPNYATAHQWYAEGYLTPMGRLDEALAALRVAQRLDPVSPIILTDIGKTLYFARRYDEAIAQLRRALDLDPTFPANGWLLEAYLEKGMYEQALKIIESEKVSGGRRESVAGSAYVSARMGRREQARKLLAELPNLSQREHVDPGEIATAYLALGDEDQAFTWLERAYAERSNYMSSLKVWPIYDPVRSDPRFLDLERRVNLVP